MSSHAETLTELLGNYPLSCNPNYHYENTPMQYTEIVLDVKMKIFTGKILIFFLFLLKTYDRGYMLEPPQRGGAEAVLTSTHNLRFGTKIRKIGIPLHTPISV